jgi:3',5'-nucleoside bisphosphate phosphatase
MKIDLHSHTYYSDGQLSPKELIDRAHNMQVDVLAITDHDTVAGLAEAIDYQATQKRSLQIISGVEISTSWHNFDIHILGLNFDRQNPILLSRLEQQSRSRDDRAREIAAKLAKVGIENMYEEASLLANKGQLSRAHFARALVARGVVNDNEAAFKKYLGKGKRAHIKPQWIEIDEAISWVHEAGGKAVLAHPGHYDMTAKWLGRLISVFAEAGGDGMEVIHSHLSPERKQQLANLAAQHDLCASAGSDFHFPNRWTELGRNLKLPEQLIPIWQDWHLGCLAN